MLNMVNIKHGNDGHEIGMQMERSLKTGSLQFG